MSMLEYFAGFIDGEGCLDVNVQRRGVKYIRYVPRLRISQVGGNGLKVLKEIKRLFGGTIETYIEKRERRGTRYTLVISGRLKLYPLLNTLHPYLMLKREQATEVINYFECIGYSTSDKEKGPALLGKLKELKDYS